MIVVINELFGVQCYLTTPCFQNPALYQMYDRI